MNNINIFRTSQSANRAKKINIYINGKKVTGIKNGGKFNISIDSMSCDEIYAKIDWCKTKPIKLDFSKNSNLYFEVSSDIKGIKLPLSFY